ncbi:hypothetical protein HMPREF3156_00232 [Neisseria sp. HMSC06F02]|nr:hypothetical protein HMPREF3156_00232 [Neisseria sp. HMSC06F02]
MLRYIIIGFKGRLNAPFRCYDSCGCFRRPPHSLSFIMSFLRRPGSPCR